MTPSRGNSPIAEVAQLEQLEQIDQHEQAVAGHISPVSIMGPEPRTRAELVNDVFRNWMNE